MRISTLLLGAALSLSPFPAMMAQTYCQPTKNSGGNNWAHANSQPFLQFERIYSRHTLIICYQILEM